MTLLEKILTDNIRLLHSVRVSIPPMALPSLLLRRRSLHLLRRRHFSVTSSPSSSHSLLPLSFPTFQIWASNTSLGKTLVSAGLAFASVSSSSSPSRFLYLKPVQTGFPPDSDSLFLFRKLSSLSLLFPPPFPLRLSHHVLKVSLPAAQAILPDSVEGLETNSAGFVELGDYEERLVGEREEGKAGEVVSMTGWAWKEAVSPDLAAKREGGRVDDTEVLLMLSKSLWNESEDKARETSVFCVVETAGGVASPGPSGTLQCNLYRQVETIFLLFWSFRRGICFVS